MLQLGMALHHDQHDASELTGDCVACVQHEQFDDLVTSPASVFVIVPDYAVATTTIAALPAPRLLPSYHGRAPPTHS